jgi:hypothetical protein
MDINPKFVADKYFNFVTFLETAPLNPDELSVLMLLVNMHVKSFLDQVSSGVNMPTDELIARLQERAACSGVVKEVSERV